METGRLDTDCTCVTLDRDALCHALADAVGDPDFCRRLLTEHPHLVSAQPVFLSRAHADAMASLIRTIEAVAQLPAYRDEVLARAPDIARYAPGPVGVFMGYDFHLGPDGPRLIEINTNAGGALLNAYLLQAQRACCAEMGMTPRGPDAHEHLLAQFVESFRSEWRRQGRAGPVRTIAIVDDDPLRQYLHPEFELFQHLFVRHGISATIAAPEELQHRDGALLLAGKTIDLVYNRLTDFDFSNALHAELRSAYLAGHAVVTPNPWVHAQLADKRNLVTLTDVELLSGWGVAPEPIATLRTGVPRTVLVTPGGADELWARRDKLFFKPSSGYGSKAAYRGDKLTRKVWAGISGGSYVAQALVPPSPRSVIVDGKRESLKADLRCYTYAGEVLLMAARLYQGQTTNFRTPGGGFAPVVVGGAGQCSCP